MTNEDLPTKIVEVVAQTGGGKLFEIVCSVQEEFPNISSEVITKEINNLIRSDYLTGIVYYLPGVKQKRTIIFPRGTQVGYITNDKQ